MVVQYYNTVVEVPFSVEAADLSTSIFIGTDKPKYNPGDIVEVQLIISELVSSNAVLSVTDPTGKITTKTFPVASSLTRILLDNVSTLNSGTYKIEIDYGGNKKEKVFLVDFDKKSSTGPDIDLKVSSDRLHYRPGETFAATVQTNQLLADNISYWLEDPNGITGTKSTVQMSSGISVIPYFIPKNSVQGPWKFYVDYASAVRYTIFFVEGEPLDQADIILTEKYKGPQILMTIGELANLNNPQGIAVDSNDDIFVVDSGNFEIKKFDSKGRLQNSWGSFGTDEGQLKNPTGIMLDSNYVHIADTGNARIHTFDKEGNFVKTWGNSGIPTQSLVHPLSISKDSSNNFYVSDARLNKIPKFDTNGAYVGHIESLLASAAKFSSSNFIIHDNHDNLFVLVSEDNRVLQFGSNGKFIKSFGTQGDTDGKFNEPTALAIDTDGNLYVADSGNAQIQVFDSNQKFLTKWGTLGNGPGQFNKISGIAVDSQGNILVVDPVNNRIQKFAAISKQTLLEIPEWIKNNAKWWNEGTIGDIDFANGIEFMIKEKIIKIPDLGKSGESTGKKIPDWIRNNAGWWADGSISDQEFVNGIEFLVKNGIIKV
jgi:hypothetical protein